MQTSLAHLQHIFDLGLDVVQGLLDGAEGEHHDREQQLVLQLAHAGQLGDGVEAVEGAHTGPAVQVTILFYQLCALRYS